MAMAMQVALLTRWEWFKLRRRWVPWILLGFVLVIVQLLFWLVATLGDEVSYQSPTENIANGLGFSAFFGPFIAVILAAAVLGGEYGWGTLRPVLSKGAGRWPFLASKVAVVVLVTASVLIILSITVMISGFIAEAILTADPQAEGYGAISWVDLLALFGRMIYGFLPYIMLALFLVVLTTSNGVGIGLSLGYYIAETIILVPILAIFDWSDQVFRLFAWPQCRRLAVRPWQWGGPCLRHRHHRRDVRNGPRVYLRDHLRHGPGRRCHRPLSTPRHRRRERRVETSKSGHGIERTRAHRSAPLHCIKPCGRHHISRSSWTISCCSTGSTTSPISSSVVAPIR